FGETRNSNLPFFLSFPSSAWERIISAQALLGHLDLEVCQVCRVGTAHHFRLKPAGFSLRYLSSNLLFFNSKLETQIYPLITPSGFSFATFLAMPAPWQTSTTMATSL